jgi:hypothetical protein
MSISRFWARPVDHAFHDAHHPAGAFAARRALAAALVLEEGLDAPDRLDDVGRLVHHDHAAGAERGLLVAQTVEIHDGGHHVLAAHDRTGRAARDHGEQVVPAAADATAMLFDQLLEGAAQRIFEHVQGLLTWPETMNSLVPVLFGRPMPANQARHGAGFPA